MTPLLPPHSGGGVTGGRTPTQAVVAGSTRNPATYLASSEHAVEPRALGEIFHRAFHSHVATTHEQLRTCHRLRYQVYCVDHPFEDPREHADGLETDRHDGHSVHSLLVHRATGRAVGTARIVLPRHAGSPRPLPIQQLAGRIASDGLAPFPPALTAEISRLAIDKSFHGYPRGADDASISPEEWNLAMRHLPLGLFRCCLHMCLAHGIRYLAAVMEPSLLRLLARLGIHMHLLGGLVEHHGLRQPCWVEGASMLSRTRAQRPDVWRFLTDDGSVCP